MEEEVLDVRLCLCGVTKQELDIAVHVSMLKAALLTWSLTCSILGHRATFMSHLLCTFLLEKQGPATQHLHHEWAQLKAALWKFQRKSFGCFCSLP